MTQVRAFVNAIGTAVPGHDIHEAFVDWAARQIDDTRERAMFRRMAARSGIAHRWSVLPEELSPVAEGGFYCDHPLPPTSARMELYAREAPRLALAAIAALGTLGSITHLVLASCTGFVAPGIDQIIAGALGLGGDVERTLVGFMGCYAAVAALRTARHIVRSEPEARVLVVTVELSTLHLQPERSAGPLLAMLQFGDGAAAALVTAQESGLEIERCFAATLADSDGLIRWTVGDQGFAMHLSGEVPTRIGHALAAPELRAAILDGRSPETIDAWAVHAGGRSILDAVASGLDLPPAALDRSRAVLREQGNMSSATLMFVLADLLRERDWRRGIAIAFGPGLAAEGFAFGRAS